MELKTFYTESGTALEHIDQVLGDLEHELLDVSLSGDVLTLAFEDGAKFVINAHSAAEQIWMAAGTTAWHFDYVSERGEWIAGKTDEELMATVARVVGAKLGETIRL
jgi:CyaY protein